MSRVITVAGFRFARRRPTARRVPRLESLEDRRLLATFNPVPSAFDGTPGSLREAVISADENLQDNTIVLQAGTYQLKVHNTAGQENNAAEGDLDLTPVGHRITIEGAGADSTIIDGGSIDRVFQVMSGVNVVISGVTIQQGVAVDAGNAGEQPDTVGAFGGGILNAGTLELDDVIIQNCTAAGGFGLDGGTGNSPTPGATGYSALGGGIYNSGTLTINRSIIRADAAIGGLGGDGGSGGGFSGTGGSGGFGAGGGIADIGPMTISQSTIADNEADGGNGGNGGVDTAGDGAVGGTGGNAEGGGLELLMTTAPIQIIDSTVANNTATGGAGGQGGQGQLGGPPSRTPGAYGGSGGSGGYAKGAGIFASSPFALYNSTVAANQAFSAPAGQGGPGANGTSPGPSGQPGDTGPAFAGGIWAPSDPGTPGLVTAVSSLIALNTDVPVGLAAEPDDVVASFESTTNTLVQDGDGATGLTDHADGNLLGVDPKLGPLQDNGGPTPTMALLPGSPAIDAGSNPLGLTSDQRGYSPRVVGPAADIGAFEVGANAPPNGNGGGTTGGDGGGGTTGGNTGNGGGTTGGQGNPAGGNQGNPAGGANPALTPVPFTTVKHSWGHCIYVYRGWRRVRICFRGPWHSGPLQVYSADIGGSQDIVVRRPIGHKQFTTQVFNGTSGSPLPGVTA
jgi:hypothetical protein